jgi:beta-N-acetylhexosaminidase
VIFKVGDVLPLRTGVITDHNGHVVPDGTVVQFIFASEAGLGGTQQVQAQTQGGIARARYRISTPGLIEVRAESDPATSSDVLRLDVSPTEGGVLEAFTPTPKPSPTPTQAPTPTATAIPTPVPGQGSGGKGPLLGWLLNALLSWGMALAFFVVGGRVLRFAWLRRAAPYVLVVGLLAYLWMLLGLPGSMPLDPPGSAVLAAVVCALLAGALGALVVSWPSVWAYLTTLGHKGSADEAENEPGSGEK